MLDPKRNPKCPSCFGTGNCGQAGYVQCACKPPDPRLTVDIDVPLSEETPEPKIVTLSSALEHVEDSRFSVWHWSPSNLKTHLYQAVDYQLRSDPLYREGVVLFLHPEKFLTERPRNFTIIAYNPTVDPVMFRFPSINEILGNSMTWPKKP